MYEGTTRNAAQPSRTQSTDCTEISTLRLGEFETAPPRYLEDEGPIAFHFDGSRGKVKVVVLLEAPAGVSS